MHTPFTELIHFAVVVDGEVATHFSFQPEDEMNIAILNSNPTFIQVPFEDRPELGAKWDGKNFIS